jgi:hypothetical protein
VVVVGAFSAGERPRLSARSPCHVFTLFTRTHKRLDKTETDESLSAVLLLMFAFVHVLFFWSLKELKQHEISIVSIRLNNQLFTKALSLAFRQGRRTKDTGASFDWGSSAG